MHTAHAVPTGTPPRRDALRDGFVPGGAKSNARYVSAGLVVDEAVAPIDKALALDPQTSGGLLLFVAAEQAEDLAAQLEAAGLMVARRVSRAALLAVGGAALAVVVGVVASYHADLPTGPTVVVAQAALLPIAAVIRKLRR